MKKTSNDFYSFQQPGVVKRKVIYLAYKVILFLVICLPFTLAYINNVVYKDLGLNMLLIVSFIGLCIGFFAIFKQIRIKNHPNNSCSLSNESDCNNILDSKAAKLWGVIRWSEIGTGYFTANVVIVVFYPSLITYVALINILALPYSFWSVWYQKVKAGQWCFLCLMAQVVLWSIFTINLLFGYIQPFVADRSGLTEGLTVIGIYAISILSINVFISSKQWKVNGFRS